MNLHLVLETMLVLALLALVPVVYRNHCLYKEIYKWDAVNKALKYNITISEQENAAFERSPQAREHAARDILGYQGKKDLTIVFD